MSDSPAIGPLYRAARERITALVSSVPEVDHDRPVPATPAWTVHDVVAHLTGIVDDALHGRMEGAPGEAWTARQVEAGRGVPVADLLDAWGTRAPALEARPELPVPLLADVLTHEHDLRGALGRPGARDEPALRWATGVLTEGFLGRATLAGLPPVRVVAPPRSWGPAEAGVVLETDAFELFRAMFGRRSTAQLRALGWAGGDPGPYLEHLVIFTPAGADLVE
jgi:uncharacterized protein (TIGR03083 family)